MIILDPIYLPTGEIYADIDGQEMTIPVCKGNYFYDQIILKVKSGELVIAPVKKSPADVQLRNQRDMLLQQTDIPWSLADYVHPKKQAWLDYRQALRDLPATAVAKLDENGNLININWPAKPEPADEPGE